MVYWCYYDLTILLILWAFRVVTTSGYLLSCFDVNQEMHWYNFLLSFTHDISVPSWTPQQYDIKDGFHLHFFCEHWQKTQGAHTLLNAEQFLHGFTGACKIVFLAFIMVTGTTAYQRVLDLSRTYAFSSFSSLSTWSSVDADKGWSPNNVCPRLIWKRQNIF